MKAFSSDCTFDYSWEEVSTANWRKYCPWNDKSPHVLAVDTLSRNVEPSTGILRTERLITCNQTAPRWVVSLLGGDNMSYVYEVSYVDPITKKVTMCSTNLTWSNVLNVRETVVYRQSPSMPNTKTQFQQEAMITALCSSWQKIKNKVEEASVERFSQNAKRGREGFEAVLEMSRRVFGEEREKQRMHASWRWSLLQMSYEIMHVFPLLLQSISRFSWGFRLLCERSLALHQEHIRTVLVDFDFLERPRKSFYLLFFISWNILRKPPSITLHDSIAIWILALWQ